MKATPGFNSILALLKDPPPEFAFEIAADGIAMSRTRPPASLQFAPLAPGIIAPSPVKENVLDAVAFTAAVKKLVPPPTGRGKRGCTLILPDNSVRITVLDFDRLPDKQEELRSLIQFRLRKSVPFDVDEAALSWHVQSPNKIIAALAPAEIVAHYEAPFRAAGLHPGMVTVSSLAMLDLMPPTGSVVVARRSSGVLTVLSLEGGIVTIARALELPESSPDPLEEIAADVYPTLAYIEDQTGKRPERLTIAGFGADAESAAVRLAVELDIPVDAMDEPYPGLAGYLASLEPSKRKAVA
jgi:type IV pilus assembly protein PilM